LSSVTEVNRDLLWSCAVTFFLGRRVTAMDISYFYGCSLFVCLTKIATTKAAYILVMYYFKLHRKITWTEVAYFSCHMLLFWVPLQNSLIFVWDLSLIFQYHRMNLFVVFLCLKWRQITSCCILSFGWFPGVWILYANISEHCVCSIFIGGVSRKNLLTPPMKMEQRE